MCLTNKKTEHDQAKKKLRLWKNKKTNDTFNMWLEFICFCLCIVFVVFMKQTPNMNNKDFTEKTTKKENTNPLTGSTFEHVFYYVDKKTYNKKTP